MLIRFVVSNFLSFKEETEFNMLTGSVRQKKEHIYQADGVELLKTAAIYGPNGAGKSNLIKAITLVKNLVTKGEISGFEIEPFRMYNKLDKPSQFEVEFTYQEQTYAYGLSLLDDAIVEEWFYKIRNEKDIIIFERTEQDDQTRIKLNDKFLQNEEDRIRIKLYEDELLTKSKLLITMLASAKKRFADIELAFQWIVEHLIIIDTHSKAVGLAVSYHFQKPFKNFVDNLLNEISTGIAKLKLETISLKSYLGEDDKELANRVKRELKNDKIHCFILPEDHSNHVAFAVYENRKIVVKRLITLHRNMNNEYIEFDINEESDGTQRLLDYIAMFFDIINHNKVLLIDEIDQSIHTALLKKLVAKFVNDPNTKGQLIFTTHDSNLLDQNIFRRDEIWFAEKQADGSTAMYPLSDFKIRYDLDIEKGYLNGRFGAIPFLGNLDDLNWTEYAA